MKLYKKPFDRRIGYMFPEEFKVDDIVYVERLRGGPVKARITDIRYRDGIPSMRIDTDGSYFWITSHVVFLGVRTSDTSENESGVGLNSISKTIEEIENE
jgi:hypothetical protein